MIDVIHLYMLNTCGHDCPLCCNKLYDISKLPTVTPELLSNAHTICLTGGDPFYIGELPLIDFVNRMRKQYPNIEKVYVYTSGSYLRWYLADRAKGIPDFDFMRALNIDGVTISPKNEKDWRNLQAILMSQYGCKFLRSLKSNRLLVFDDQKDLYESLVARYIYFSSSLNLQVLGRKWDKTFKTPDNEYFCRLPVLF